MFGLYLEQYLIIIYICTMSANNVSLKSWITLGALSIIWGSSFILIKKSLLAFDPYSTACMRIAISALAFTPVIIIKFKSIDWSKWKLFLAVGMTGSGIPAFMYFIAQTQISSSVSGLLNSLTPIWTLTLGIVFFGVGFRWKQLSGVILGFLGAMLLILFGQNSGANENIWFGFFVVVGTLCYGFSGNIVKSFFQKTPALIISAVSFCMIGIPAILYLLTTDIYTVIQTHSDAAYSLGAIFILAIVGTVLSTIVFYQLVQQTSPVFGSSVAYLMPIVAILWGYIDGETLSAFHFIGLVSILVGVYLIQKNS